MERGYKSEKNVKTAKEERILFLSLCHYLRNCIFYCRLTTAISMHKLCDFLKKKNLINHFDISKCNTKIPIP